MNPPTGKKPTVYVIGKKTPITIGLLTSIIGGVAWLTDLKHQNDANASMIQELRVKQDQGKASLHKIEKWLAAIGQKLNVREPQGE